MIKLGNNSIGKVFIGSSSVRDAFFGDTLVYQEKSTAPAMTLILHWDGTDAPTSSRWYDKVSNQYWTLTNATHGSNYYEFLNSAPNSSTARGQLNGGLPDLRYHWKIVADVEVKVNTSATGMVAFDFGSIGTVASGGCAVACYLTASGQRWAIGAKFDGNSSGSTYNVDGTNLVDPDFENDAWIRRTITIGVKSSSTPGKDVAYINVSDVGYGETPTPFEPLRFNRWSTSAANFLARSRVVPNNTYKYATSARIYDIKVYYEPIV